MEKTMETIIHLQNKIKKFFTKNKKHVSMFSKVGVIMFLALWFSGLTKTATDMIFVILVVTVVAIILFFVHPSKFQI